MLATSEWPQDLLRVLAQLWRSRHYGFCGAGEACYRPDGLKGATIGMRYFDYHVQCLNLRMGQQ